MTLSLRKKVVHLYRFLATFDNMGFFVSLFSHRLDVRGRRFAYAAMVQSVLLGPAGFGNIGYVWRFTPRPRRYFMSPNSAI